MSGSDIKLRAFADDNIIGMTMSRPELHWVPVCKLCQASAVVTALKINWKKTMIVPWRRDLSLSMGYRAMQDSDWEGLLGPNNCVDKAKYLGVWLGPGRPRQLILQPPLPSL